MSAAASGRTRGLRGWSFQEPFAARRSSSASAAGTGIRGRIHRAGLRGGNVGNGGKNLAGRGLLRLFRSIHRVPTLGRAAPGLLLFQAGELGVLAGSSRTERRAAAEPLRARDLEMLRWMGEQYGARVDQLEVLLGCDPRTVQRVLARLRAAGLIDSQAAGGRGGLGDPDEPGPARVRSGIRVVASASRAARTCRDGQRRAAAHRAAFAAERMGVRACPRARPRAGRASPRRGGDYRGAHCGDRGRAHRKSHRRVQRFSTSSGRYEAVLYFCAPRRTVSSPGWRRADAGPRWVCASCPTSTGRWSGVWLTPARAEVSPGEG